MGFAYVLLVWVTAAAGAVLDRALYPLGFPPGFCEPRVPFAKNLDDREGHLKALTSV